MGRIWNRLRTWSWKKWTVVVLTVSVVGGVGSVELTSQSWFCNSCHIMNPYYATWKKGSHKDVACVKCHISPGVDNFIAAKLNGAGQVVDDLLARTSTKPSASVTHLACLRSGCHIEEKIRSTQKTDGTFKFKHDKHLGLEFDGLKLDCGSCHSHIKGDQHFEVSTNVCITCHMLQRPMDVVVGADPARLPGAAPERTVIRLTIRRPPPEASDAAKLTATPATDAHGKKIPPATCKTCHNPPEGVLERNGLKVDHAQYLAYGASCESCHSSATATPEPMEDSRCLECHTFGIERSLPSEEMHRVHSEGKHKIECMSCHGIIRHGPLAQQATLEQFECQKCHQGQHAIQRHTYLSNGDVGKTAEGAATVSPMFLAHVDCTGCHIQSHAVTANPESGATVAVAAAAACDRCHKPGLGEQMIPLWQKTTHSLYDQVEAALKDIESDQSPETIQLVEETRKLLDTVRLDGSWGVHNPRYTQRLLEEAREKIKAARKGGQP